MTMLSVRRRATRAAALLTAGLLALGLAQAPTTASAADGAPSYAGPTVAELRALAPSAGAWARAGREARRVDVVRDPRGDAVREGAFRGARPYTRLADVTRMRYKTPTRDGGSIRVTSTWADLRDADGRGVRHQAQVTFVVGRNDDDLWAFVVTNHGDQVRLFDLGDPSGPEQRIRPERVAVERSFGPAGRTDVVMSSEWLDVRRVVFETFTFSGREEALDSVEASRILDAGPRR